ncbi:MAG TPA: hypothetical protein DCM08_07330 [Microscillaceae bacterium]|nr:hypothetical protein [Microscillaceae bacterium]
MLGYQIKVTNSIALTIVFLFLLHLGLDLITGIRGTPDYYVRLSVLIITHLCIVGLNYHRHFLLSRLLCMFSFAFFYILPPVVLRQAIPLQMVWFPFGLIVLGASSMLLFDLNKERLWWLLSFIFHSVLMFNIEALLFWANPDRFDDMPLFTTQRYLVKRIHFSFWILVSLFFYFIIHTRDTYQRKMLKSNRLLNKQMSITNELLEEIKQQNLVLVKQKNYIDQVNQDLEKKVKDRTAQLEIKNQILAEYAFMNAHILRSPLSRIEGLLYLLERPEMAAEKSLLTAKIKEAIYELETSIDNITQQIEENDLGTKQIAELRKKIG